MSYVDEISVKDANQHDYIHPMQFVGKINNCLSPWVMADFKFNQGASGKVIMSVMLVDKKRQGASRINTETGDKEYAYGIKIDVPLQGLLPTKDELELFIESVRQDLGIAGTSKIIMGR